MGMPRRLRGVSPGSRVTLPFRELAPVAGMLGVEMRRQARGQEQGVLAVFGAEGIDGLVEVGEPLHADDFPEQIQLPVIGFGEMVQDDAGGAVERAGHKDGVKGRGNGAEDVIRETGRPRQLDLSAEVPEVLGPQENAAPAAPPACTAAP